jgi:hypothetical protein
MITVTDFVYFLNKGQPVIAWVTLTAYKKGDIVSNASVIYECVVTHTSGTFATDLASGYWSITGQLYKSVNAAIADVLNYCDRDFRTAAYTEYVKPISTSKLFVKNWPVNPADGKITTLAYLDETDGTYTDVIDGSGDTIYNSTFINGYEIRLLKGYAFNTAYTYEVSYETDMTLYNGLNDVIECTLELAALDYKNSDAGGSHLAKSSMNLGGASSEGIGLITADTRDAIYKRLFKHKNIAI